MPASDPVEAGDGFLRLDEAARSARVNRKTLTAWEADGLAMHRPGAGRLVLIRRRDLIAFIEGKGLRQKLLPFGKRRI
jgi:hypothetical protein